MYRTVRCTKQIASVFPHKNLLLLEIYGLEIKNTLVLDRPEFES